MPIAIASPQLNPQVLAQSAENLKRQLAELKVKEAEMDVSGGSWGQRKKIIAVEKARENLLKQPGYPTPPKLDAHTQKLKDQQAKIQQAQADVEVAYYNFQKAMFTHQEKLLIAKQAELALTCLQAGLDEDGKPPEGKTNGKAHEGAKA